MRYLSPLLIALAGMGSAHAMDVSTQSLVVTGYVTSKVTSAPFDRKLMVQARDDAAAFVATDGLIRGVRLQAALRAPLRGVAPGQTMALYRPDPAGDEVIGYDQHGLPT